MLGGKLTRELLQALFAPGNEQQIVTGCEFAGKHGADAAGGAGNGDESSHDPRVGDAACRLIGFSRGV
jgi:hypothetical protein